MKLILKISDVWGGALVTKPTGDKKYTVRDKITILGVDNFTIDAQEGCRFLVDCFGNIQATTNDTDVAIQAEPHDLINILRDILKMKNSHQ